jgi:hypothetical protein
VNRNRIAFVETDMDIVTAGLGAMVALLLLAGISVSVLVTWFIPLGR